MAVDHFYFHPLTEEYEFGPKHPLRPERLRRTRRLLSELGVALIQPEEALLSKIQKVHSEDYIEVVRTPSKFGWERLAKHGLGSGDCPVFPRMFESTLAYCSCAIAAAKAVVTGAPRGYNIAGGLHHAFRSRAAGFCIFNDPALAINELLARWDRVAYVDIDVHHGDGVQKIFEDDPRVLCCSIHQDGRTLFPGTGSPAETGPLFNGINVICPPETGAAAWLYGFREGILPALERFQPQALVIQHGTDSHFDDPLARVRNTVQSWLAAVSDLRRMDLPKVILGGGGYRLECVPRMWVAAILTHEGLKVPEFLPETLGQEWGTPTFLDRENPYDPNVGQREIESVVNYLREFVHPKVA